MKKSWSHKYININGKIPVKKVDPCFIFHLFSVKGSAHISGINILISWKLKLLNYLHFP